MLTKDKVTKEEEPKMLDEAWNHLNKKPCRKWCEAIVKEILWHEKTAGIE